MGEWLAQVSIYAAPAWAWLAPLLAAPFLAPAIHKFLMRPIIRVQLDDQADCHERTPLVSKQDGSFMANAVYLRLRIANRGRTTIKDCFGNLLRITVWDEAGKTFDFNQEVHALGWAHYPQSTQRSIPRAEHYPLDVASLLLSPDEKQNCLFWPDVHKTSMIAFLQSLPPGKATYLFSIRVNAENARPRLVPVRFVFDPARSRLSFTPFDTRYPGWRWRWRWRWRLA
jgi:hypothetical protein